MGREAGGPPAFRQSAAAGEGEGEEGEDEEGEEAGDEDAADAGGADSHSVDGADAGGKGDGEHSEAGGDDDHDDGAEGLGDGAAHGLGRGLAAMFEAGLGVDDEDCRVDDDADASEARRISTVYFRSLPETGMVRVFAWAETTASRRLSTPVPWMVPDKTTFSGFFGANWTLSSPFFASISIV